MPSEIITYMLIFTIGLALVVSINESFDGLSNNITEESLNQGLMKVANSVAEAVQRVYVLGNQSSGQSGAVLVQLRLDLLDDLFGERFFVEFVAGDDGRLEVAAITNGTTALAVTTSLAGLDGLSVGLFGGLDSAGSVHYVRYIEGGLVGIDSIQLVSLG